MATFGVEKLVDGYLIMAHGSSAREIAERKDDPARFLPLSSAQINLAYTADQALAARTANRSELNRTELMAAKAKQRMLGIDPGEPESVTRSLVPKVPMTVTPAMRPADAIAVAPAKQVAASQRFAPVTSTVLQASTTAAAVSYNFQAPQHARSSDFANSFGRGIRGTK